MKKFILLAFSAACITLGATAQTSPGNSAFGHSHKKAKRHNVRTTSSQRRAINVQHTTTIKTATSNNALNNVQQRDQIKQANAVHRQDMKAANGNRGGKNK